MAAPLMKTRKKFHTIEISADGKTWTPLNHKEPNERKAIKFARKVMVGTLALDHVQVVTHPNEDTPREKCTIAARYKRGHHGKPVYNGGTALEARRAVHQRYYKNVLKEKRYG